MSPLGQSTLPKLAPPQPTTDWAKAAATGNVATLQRLLLEQEQDEETALAGMIDPLDPNNGNTALIWAVEYNQIHVVTFLLQHYGTHGIHINHRGYLGNTALSRAARHGHVPMLQLLLDATKMTNGNNNHHHNNNHHAINVNLPNDKLQYPLHIAAFQQHVDIVQLLLEHGANPLVLDRKGRTPSRAHSPPLQSRTQRISW